uniref:Elapor1-like galactose binding domain-containing protein n=1 Tax=Petromyzon marinus TaxID=7757 RepID=S4RQS5_PETMA
ARTLNINASVIACGYIEQRSDYRYQYTECDVTGGRWRVAVPHSPGACTGLPEPIKGTECSFSCGPGEFLQMLQQSCERCRAGSYSLGDGVLFDEWDTVPPDFLNMAAMASVEDGPDTPVENCTSSGWTPNGDAIVSNQDECTASLVYAVNLKKPGELVFEYQYPDSGLFFEFFIIIAILCWRMWGGGYLHEVCNCFSYMQMFLELLIKYSVL